MKRKVALVLSSGGARGFAHIGAIEELERRGLEISSIAGSSMGALIGGIYAAGKLGETKDWFFSLDRFKIMSLVDFSPSLNHIVKGDRIIDALNKIVPDERIENLPIKYKAISTDLVQNREIVFDRGSLFAAMRASISIPSFFKPLRTKKMLLIDGGIINPLPVNRIDRQEGDLLIAVNVSGHSSYEIDIIRQNALERQKERVWPMFRWIMPQKVSLAENYYSLMARTFALMIQQNAALTLRLCPPDVLVEIPMNRFGGFDYDKAESISEAGRCAMKQALDKFGL